MSKPIALKMPILMVVYIMSTWPSWSKSCCSIPNGMPSDWIAVPASGANTMPPSGLGVPKCTS